MLMATLVCPALALCCAFAQSACDAHSLDLDSSRRQCYSHIHTFVVVDDFEIQLYRSYMAIIGNIYIIMA
jgi:hypothetical protein